MTAGSVWNFVCYSTWARAPGTTFWLVHNWPLGLRGIYITLGYTFFSSIENFSAYCPVLRGSILLPPRHPSVFARMARWQKLENTVQRKSSIIFTKFLKMCVERARKKQTFRGFKFPLFLSGLKQLKKAQARYTLFFIRTFFVGTFGLKFAKILRTC